MNKKQISLTFFLPIAVLVATFITQWTITEDVGAESLSYNLACEDKSVGLTVTKQEAKHQVVIKCKSGAKFQYMNNSDTAKNKATGKCPGSENVGTDVDVPNGASSRLIMYCVTLSGGGGEAHATRTKNMPTVKTEKITPPGKDDDGDGGTGSDDKDGFDPGAGDGCGGAQTAILKCDADNSGGVESNGIWTLLLVAVNILTAGVGIVAVGGIVYGAILYTTAEDKADQVKKATDIITNVVIGLVLFALMWAGLNFIIPGGVFA